MKRKTLTTLIIWALVFVAIILMVNGFSGSAATTQELDYKTFLELVASTEAGESGAQTRQIKAIQITYRDVYGLFEGNDYDAEDLPKRADFHAVLPSESTFRADMAAIIYETHPGEYNSVDEISSADYSFSYESVVVEESIWSYILPTLLTVAAIGVFYYLMMRQQGGGKQMMNFGKSHARIQTDGAKQVTFADVAGADEEKEELQEIVEFMRDPGKFTSIGARTPKGVLLIGPPGTGKTLLAKAVAGEAKVPFFSISGSDFVEMFVGVGASRVRDLFLTAKRSTPAVVFIDEIDAVGRHRGAGMGGGHDEREQTLNQLLVEMDGFAPNEGIVVIAATNRPDILDPALLRPGRFDRQITVGYPDIKGREEILKVHARNKPLAKDVSLAVLARRTPGFTGADLENVLNEGAILAARDGRKEISMSQLEEAITRVQMGPEKRSRVMTPIDKQVTAYHEAGHAIVAIRLPNSDPIHEVSIIPRGAAGGYTMYLPREDMTYVRKSKLLDSIAMSLGGRVAELLKFGDVSTGAYSDLQHASQIAHKMVAEYGMSDEIGPIFLGGQTEVFIGRDWGQLRSYSEALAARVDKEIQKLLEEQYERAKETIASDMDGLERVVAALLERERLDGDEFERIYRGLPEPASETKQAAPEAEAGEKEPAAESAPQTEQKPAATEAEPQAGEEEPKQDA